jgi:type VI secretion system protein ImpJ
MSSYSKVVWSEGLFLRPQHFQQQDRYLERFVETRCSALRSHSWGCTAVELERDLLAIGKLGLKRAAGVFPDGTPFRMPDDHPLPPPLDISVQMRDQIVYLAIPLPNPSGVDATRRENLDGVVRHAIGELEARDTTSSSAAAALLEIANLNSRLLPASESTAAYARIPIAHVVECRADRQVVLEERFIPTVLDTAASVRLATFVTELVGLLPACCIPKICFASALRRPANCLRLRHRPSGRRRLLPTAMSVCAKVSSR